jgi:predicted  nucleic acid-binding Zn-ribbon protein
LRERLSGHDADPLARIAKSPATSERTGSAYLFRVEVEPNGKAEVATLVRLQKEAAETDQQIAPTRNQMQEYRNRMDELHAQIVTLTAVKTGAGLLKDLEKKMQDISRRVSQATLRLANRQGS